MERWLDVLIVTLCLGCQHTLGGPASWWDRHKDSISCQRPGYFVNQADCRSFFRCVDRSTWNKPALQRYDFTCPSGMVFDPAVSVCTKPGPNGCADPWWPGGSNSGDGGGSMEPLSPIFDSSRGPGGSRPAKKPDGPFGGNSGGKDPFDDDFGLDLGLGPKPGGNDKPFSSGRPGALGRPFGGRDPLDDALDLGAPSGSSTTPRSNTPLFNGGSDIGRPSAGTSYRDPLDDAIDLSDPSGSSTTPGSNAPVFTGGRGIGRPSADSSYRDPLDDAIDLSDPSGSSTTPGSNGPVLNGGSGIRRPSKDNSYRDPLDDAIDLSDPSGSSTTPGSNSPPFTGGRGLGGPFGGNNGGKDQLDTDFGLDLGSSTKPGGSSSPFGGRPAPFGGRGGGDPLDSDFGASPGKGSGPLGSSNLPPIFERPARPGSGSPFGGRNNNAADPLDGDFGSSTGSSGSQESSTNPTQRKGSDESCSSCSNESGDGNDNWWGSTPNSKPGWDRNGIEFDNWESTESPQISRPRPRPPANWGGSPKPRPSIPNSPTSGSGESPWRPSGPWGSNDLGTGGSSSSSNSPSIPQSPLDPSQQSSRPPPPPPPQRPSWWDPPFAMPYRPGGPGPRPANPNFGPPDPWLYSYRPRYPTFEIVAYPTWPPPFDRRPLIVVYSNSKKK